MAPILLFLMPHKVIIYAGSLALVSFLLTMANPHSGNLMAAVGLESSTLIGIAAMLVIGKIGGELFERMGQSSVLGELIGGIALGSLVVFGFTTVEHLKDNSVIGALAELGIIILLFEVGLESDIREMVEVGASSLLVAVLGVVAPFFLGWAVSAYFNPGSSQLEHVFIGATLCATSVGITARVFKDLGKLSTREARIILGAAVIDDVLGLLILALIVGAIGAASTGSELSLLNIGLIAGKAVFFLIASVALGHFVVPHVLRRAGRLETRGVLLTVALSLCLFLSWAAAKVGLAPIVGAFAAGLVLDEVHYKPVHARKERDLRELLQPVSTVLVPIFFVLMGLNVDLRFFGQLNLLGYASLLTLAAIVGKQICALGVLERGTDRLTVGLGMIPRGEVGLIFAGIGSTLTLPLATGGYGPVITPSTFGVVVIMVIITTLATPIALKWALARNSRHKEVGSVRTTTT